MHYLWWIPAVFVWYFVYYFLTVKNNVSEVSWWSDKWFWATSAMGFCPLWAVVSRISNRLVFDGMLYDTLLVLIYPFAMLAYGKMSDFSLTNYLGAGIVCVGLIMLRIGH